MACRTCGGGERRLQGFGGEPRGKKEHWVKSFVDGRIILRLVFRNLNVGVCPGLSWLMIGTGGGHL